MKLYLFFQNNPPVESMLDATLFFALLFVGTILLTSFFWYFWKKKDIEKVDVLQKDLDKLQPQHEILQNQHEHLKSEHQKVKLGLADLADSYNSLNVKHDSLMAAQSSTQKVSEKADEERQTLLDSFDAMESNYNALESRYNDTVNTLDRLEQEIDNINEDKENLAVVNAQLRKEIQLFAEVLEEKGEHVESLRNELSIAASAEEDDEIEKLIGASKGQAFVNPLPIEEPASTGIIDQEISGERKEIYESLKEKYTELLEEHEALLDAHEALQKSQEELVSKKELVVDTPQSSETLTTLQNSYETLEKENLSLKEKMDKEVLPKLRATQSLLNKKETAVRKLTSQIEVSTSKVPASRYEDLKATNQALYSSNKNLAEKNGDLEQRYEKLNAEYTGLMAQFQLLREQFGVVENKLEISQEVESTISSSAIDDLKSELAVAYDLQAKQKEQIKNLESTINGINESSGYGIIYLPSNLQIIDGIDQKVEEFLNNRDIQNWEDLANTTEEELNQILNEGGPKFKGLKSTSWTTQAHLLAKADWKGFRDLEAEMIAGRKKTEKKVDYDDLKVIEGIGPKIEVLLNNSGIQTWKKLSKTGIGELKKILKAAGSRYQVHDPSTWPEQAALAATLNWAELEELQKELKGGRAQA